MHGTNLPLQAWMPSAHVRSNCVSPASPQSLNQEPPRAQQLLLPALLVAHLGHMLLLLTADELVVVGASVEECGHSHNTKGNSTDVPLTPRDRHMVRALYVRVSQEISFTEIMCTEIRGTKMCLSTTHLCRPGCPRPMCDQTLSRRHCRSS